MDDLKFPIGQYIPIKQPDDETLYAWVNVIKLFPKRIIELTVNLKPNELQWQYRPGGWTIKQLVHHCADSHINSLIRFKLALTEDKPEIRPYFENRWAELPDSLEDNIKPSLDLIRTLHRKWVILLKNLTSEQLELEFIHPEHGTSFNLAETIGNYAWHCQHHLAHIELALNSKGKC